MILTSEKANLFVAATTRTDYWVKRVWCSGCNADLIWVHCKGDKIIFESSPCCSVMVYLSCSNRQSLRDWKFPRGEGSDGNKQED